MEAGSSMPDASAQQTDSNAPAGTPAQHHCAAGALQIAGLWLRSIAPVPRADAAGLAAPSCLQAISGS